MVSVETHKLARAHHRVSSSSVVRALTKYHVVVVSSLIKMKPCLIDARPFHQTMSPCSMYLE